MSEFKFACPVCGQHITADHSASGSHIECPTCFTKLVVPVSRAGAKLVYSAAKVSDSRPVSTFPVSLRRRSVLSRIPFAGISFLLALAAAVGGAGLWWKKVQRERADLALAHAALTNGTHAALQCGIPWNANPTNVSIPDKPISGILQGRRFSADRVTLQGGTLGIRQGHDWPPELGLHVLLFARKPENLAEKTIVIWPDRPPPIPKLVMRWKDETGTNRTQDVRSGYSMRIVFGAPTNNVLPGSIYVSLPEEEQGVISGTFEAEIRKPAPRSRPSATRRPADPE